MVMVLLRYRQLDEDDGGDATSQGYGSEPYNVIGSKIKLSEFVGR